MRAVQIGAVGALGVLAYAGVLTWPHPVFPYGVAHQGVVLHSRAPLPPNTAAILADARRRLTRSPLYRASDHYDVFLCDSPPLFAFFARWNYRAGAVAFWPLTGNIFLRPAHVERNRLVGPSGREAAGERTLAYFIAHEMTHTLVVRSIGRIGYARLERWQTEGYADYVAKSGDFDFMANLRALHNHEPELDPDRSGLYRRYHLLVAYLLDVRRMSADALLAQPIPQAKIEQEVSTLDDAVQH